MVTNNSSNNTTANSGKVLQGQGVGTASAFSTATFPSTATTTGTVLVSDGTNWVASTPTFPNASATSGKFIRSDGTNWIASTPTLPTTAGTSGKILISDATNFISSTPTYPNIATGTGTILRADGTNWVASTSTYPDTNAVSTLLYASSSNVISALATANSAVLVTNSSGVPSITTAGGNYLNTSRTCVMAYCSNNKTDVTGDSTDYTVIFDTALVDQASNFNTSTGVFTAPVTGNYLVICSILTQQNVATSTTSLKLAATGRNYTFGNYATSNTGNFPIAFSAIIPMTATNTFSMILSVGGGTKTVDVYGASDLRSYLSVYLLC